MGLKRCWTCRERKVRCDLLMPACGNCVKGRRVCKGYGIKLSWPRDGDGKRALVMRDVHHNGQDVSLPGRARRFLNSSFWDLSLSAELDHGITFGAHLRTMQVPRPTYLSPIIITKRESQLVGFFNESRSLLLGPTDEESLAQFILQVALSNPSDTKNPVLQGVLALASQQLHGGMESFRYKHLVMSFITESINRLNQETLLQTLMAAMLLYHYELALDSNSKGTWVTFICTVKRIINTSPAMQKLMQGEYSVFLEWIYYHEVLAEFSVRHWKVPYEGCGWAPIARSSKAIEGGEPRATGSIGCPIDVLELLTQVCLQGISGDPAEKGYTIAGKEHTKILQENVSKTIGDYGPISERYADRNTMVSNLHRLACLIYVNRTASSVSGIDFHHKRLVREGILLLTEMETCQNAWPLFIIACEAADDEQRLAILDVFEKSRQDRRRRWNHIHFIQHTVEAIWKQQDLDVEEELDYLTVLNAVISGLPFVPAFA